MKIEPDKEVSDLEELRREIATQEVAERYDRDNHINQIKSEIIKNLDSEIPVKVTDEIYELGLYTWFIETTRKYEAALRMKQLIEKSFNQVEDELGLDTYNFRFLGD